MQKKNCNVSFFPIPFSSTANSTFKTTLDIISKYWVLPLQELDSELRSRDPKKGPCSGVGGYSVNIQVLMGLQS